MFLFENLGVIGAGAVALVAGTMLMGCALVLRPHVPDGGWRAAFLDLMEIGAWTLLVVAGITVPGIGLVGLLTLGYVAFQYHRGRQYAFLGVLLATAERGLPLAPALQALAREQWGKSPVRLRRLARRLEAGEPLPDALEAVGRLAPRPALLLIRMGHDSGTLGPALRTLLDVREMYVPLWFQASVRMAYLMWIFGMGTLLNVFVMIKIVPAYKKIFEDFSVELPQITQTLIGRNNSFLGGAMILILAAGYAAAVVAALHYFDALPWSMPLVGRLTRRRHTAAILECLSLVVGGHQPLPEALRTLAAHYPRWPIRRRLERIAAEVHGGLPWQEGLARQGLIGKAELVVLHTAERVGNLAWALQELADSSRRRLACRIAALVQVIFPAVLIGMGAVVAFFVVAMFSPLVALIQSLTGGPAL